MALKADIILNQRYRLAERIGSGGFSVVWKASDLQTGNMPVAVKVFMPDKGVDNHLIDMFRDEYNLTSTLDDNRLVRMTDYFVEGESPCLVMPYMPGGSLYQKLQKEGPLSEREVARVLYQVGGALHYLHAQEKPVLHLDIKPENILIDYSGNYLLADFGISLKMRSSLLRASNTKGGTFGYTPPEMSESRKAGPPADIFSLGVMLFELCTGDLPWSGMGGNAVIIGMPLPLLPDSYSLRLQQMAHLCMGRYPHERPTAIQLEELARKYLDRGYWDALITDKPEEGLEKAKPEPDITSGPQPPPPAPPASAEPEKEGRATQKTPARVLEKITHGNNPQKPESFRKKIQWLGYSIIGVIAFFVTVLFLLSIGFGKISPKRNNEIEMVFVKGGTFTMGCTAEQGSDCESDEKPAHTVTLSDFYIGKYEVTQKQWVAIMGSNPSRFKGCDDCPVESVSWNDIQEFIRILNQKTGKQYRLPTEAEWEYAARGGAELVEAPQTNYAGSNNIDKVAWYNGNSGGKTHPVGGKKPNELGLYDMSGNVWEWCSDWYGSYSRGHHFNPNGPLSSTYRIVRGGSWGSRSNYCRITLRGNYTPDRRGHYHGFRLALSP